MQALTDKQKQIMLGKMLNVDSDTVVRTNRRLQQIVLDLR